MKNSDRSRDNLCLCIYSLPFSTQPGPELPKQKDLIKLAHHQPPPPLPSQFLAGTL